MTAAPTINPDVLRERATRTAEALRQITAHLARLQQAKEQREKALAKFRAELALAEGPQAPDSCDA